MQALSIELIVVMYKDEWKKANEVNQTPQKMNLQNGQMECGLFRVKEKKKIGHPAPFYVELPKRCIKLFSYVGDIVLNLFMCSGITIVASKMLDRK